MANFKSVFLPDTLVVVTNISQDQQVAETLVQSLLVEFVARPKPSAGQVPISVGRNLGDPPLVASQTASLFVAVTGDEPEVSVQILARGYVSVEPGAKAALVVRVSGTTFSNDLVPTVTDGTYELTHSVRVVPGKGLLLTLVLIVDRSLVDGALPGALATVDKIDFSFDSASTPP